MPGKSVVFADKLFAEIGILFNLLFSLLLPFASLLYHSPHLMHSLMIIREFKSKKESC